MADDAPKTEDKTFIVDMLLAFMQNASWNDPIVGFINEKCVLFDNFQEENKHEYVEIHNQFKVLIDSLLAAHLLERDIDPDEFETLCKDGTLSNDPRFEKVVSNLVAAEDFLNFKAMMIGHHTNMQHEAEDALVRAAADEAAAKELAAKEKAEKEASAAEAARAAEPSPASAPPQFMTEAAAPSAEQERAFGAGGGFYGRAGGGAKKPASNEKASAIRKALTSALRPK